MPGASGAAVNAPASRGVPDADGAPRIGRAELAALLLGGAFHLGVVGTHRVGVSHPAAVAAGKRRFGRRVRAPERKHVPIDQRAVTVGERYIVPSWVDKGPEPHGDRLAGQDAKRVPATPEAPRREQ